MVKPSSASTCISLLGLPETANISRRPSLTAERGRLLRRRPAPIRFAQRAGIRRVRRSAHPRTNGRTNDRGVLSEPAGSEDVGAAVAEAVRLVRESGLPNETNAMFTNVEGEWDEVMALIKSCVLRLAEDSPRVSVVIKVDYRPGITDALQWQGRNHRASLWPSLPDALGPAGRGRFSSVRLHLEDGEPAGRFGLTGGRTAS